MTAGCARNTLRTSEEIRAASSNEMSTGIVARTHRLPSSRAGMNSPPINGSAASATSTSADASATVSQRFTRAQRRAER